MKAEHWQRIHDELISACIALFRDNGVELQVAPEGTERKRIEGPGVVSFIGFLGDHMRGHLTMLAPVEVITLSHPLREQAVMDEGALCDWARELANQLLGRIKLRLIDFGIVIQISMPSAALGDRVRGYEEQHEGFRVITFVTNSERLEVAFDAQATDLAPETLRQSSETAQQPAGDLLLF